MLRVSVDDRNIAVFRVIDGKAELERRKMMNEAELHKVQLMSKADAEKMKKELEEAGAKVALK